MDIALAKRRENIAEYILYLWQIEDLLRHCNSAPRPSTPSSSLRAESKRDNATTT